MEITETRRDAIPAMGQWSSVSDFICEQSLELLVRIMESGAECALRDVDELGNLRVGKSLDIAEVNHFLVSRGKL